MSCAIALSPMAVTPPAILNEECAEKVRNFARIIWEQDVCPPPLPGAPPATVEERLILKQEALLSLPHGVLKAPLPLQTATSIYEDRHGRDVVQMQQLLVSRGEDANLLLDTAFMTGSQTPTVFIGSAPSEVGKTHLAYAAGKRFASIIIPTMTYSMIPVLTPPFAWLSARLRHLQSTQKASEADKFAVDASIYLKTVIVAFMAVTLEVIEFAASTLVDAHDQPKRMAELPEEQQLLILQVVLRFHRNGVSNKLACEVLRYLEQRLRTLEGVEPFCPIDGNALEVYVEMICSRLPPTLITVDDAHALTKLLDPSLNSLFNAEAEKSIDATKSAPGRDAFHGLIYVLNQLTNIKGSHVRAYVTGTSYSMKTSTTDAALFSGNTPVHLMPSFKMQVANMESILRHYINVPDEWCEQPGGALHSDLVASLQVFEGRPNFFVDGVWTTLITHIIFRHTLPSLADFQHMLASELEDLLQRWTNRYSAYFKAAIAREEGLAEGTTTRQLLPYVVESVLMADGIVLVDGEDQVAEAARIGILAVSRRPPFVYDMKSEPIVFRALKAVILRASTSPTTPVLDLLLHTRNYCSKGTKREKWMVAMAWHLALVSYKGSVQAAIRNPGLPSPRGVSPAPELSLGEVLRTFGNSVAKELPQSVSQWTFSATRICDMHGVGDPFKNLVDPVTSQPDTSVILCNIPTSMGVDIAFVVFSPPVNEYALVALKYVDAPCTAEDALLPMHPGTQYLDDNVREALRRNTTPASVQTVAVKEFSSYVDAAVAAAGTPSEALFANWIRIPVVTACRWSDAAPASPALGSAALAVEAALPDVARSSRTNQLERLSSELGARRLSVAEPFDAWTDSWSADQLYATRQSPVVWLFLKEAGVDAGSRLPTFSDRVKRSLTDGIEDTALTVTAETAAAYIPISIDDARAHIMPVSAAGTR